MIKIDTSTAAVMELMDGITAGPWTEHNAGKHPYVYVCGPDQLYYNGEVTDKPLVAYITGIDALKNRAFIAASRELVPALLSERDAAVSLYKKAEAQVEVIAAACKSWRKRSEQAECERDAAVLRAEQSEAREADAAALVKALRFYADDQEENRLISQSQRPWGVTSDDFGAKARAAITAWEAKHGKE